MTRDQELTLTLTLVLVAATVALFIWGRRRRDAVALGALVASVTPGLVPGEHGPTLLYEERILIQKR